MLQLLSQNLKLRFVNLLWRTDHYPQLRTRLVRFAHLLDFHPCIMQYLCHSLMPLCGAIGHLGRYGLKHYSIVFHQRLKIQPYEVAD